MPEQTYKNHTRLDPTFHFVILPALLVNLIVAIVRWTPHRDFDHGWTVIIAVVLLLFANLVRAYALRVQDRVIRLEERIRMAALLPLDAQPIQRELTTGQIIALRFASDAELASLAERAVRDQLSPRQIKQAIARWRPDTHRV